MVQRPSRPGSTLTPETIAGRFSDDHEKTVAAAVNTSETAVTEHAYDNLVMMSSFLVLNLRIVVFNSGLMTYEGR